MKINLTAFLLFTLSVLPLRAAPGDLDGTFGTSGKVSVSGVGYFNCVSRQADGKILAGGIQADDFALVRLTSTGALDGTFGTGGKVTTDFNGFNDQIHGVAVQTDGKIVAAGLSYDIWNDLIDVVLARYNTNGTLDNTFGTGGKVITNFSNDDRAFDVELQTDGKIVVAGLTRVGADESYFLARYNTNGTLDTTFGTGGKVTTSVSGGLSSAERLVIQTDGKIVIAGNGGNNYIKVARFFANGTLDGGFGTSGVVSPGLRNGGSVALQADGKILISGTTGALTDQFGIVRLLANGEQDDSFGYFGSINTSIGTNGSIPRDILFRNDWKIVLIGFTTNGANTDFALAQYHPNGTLDTGFGTGGKVTASMTAGNDYGISGVVQSDGKILVAGLPATVARFDGGGTTNYSPPGVATTETTNRTTTSATINGTVNPSGIISSAYFEYGLTASYGNTVNVTLTPNTGTSNVTASANLTGLEHSTTYHFRLVANNAGGQSMTSGTTFATVTPAPEISLFAGPTISSPTLSDGQSAALDYGSTILGTPIVKSFTARNTGTGDLLITGLTLPAGFELVGGGTLNATVPPSATYTFEVAFLANTLHGNFNGIFSLLNNDSNESSYDIPLQAFAMGAGGGSTDPSFGNDGIVATDFAGTNDQAHDVVTQSDGNIVVAGYSRVGSTDDFAVARYLPTGGLDPSFGTGGKVTTPIGTGTDRAHAVAIQSDGKILAAGYARIGSTDDFAVVRYDTDGILDTSFGTGGKLTVAFGTGADLAYSMALQSDGKIVIGGSATYSTVDFAMMRCLADGTLDPDFGAGGKVVTPIGTTTDICRSLAIQSDGKIVAAGEASMGSASKNFAFVRYTSTGSLDNTFGISGVTTLDVAGNSADTAYGVVIQSDGKIVAGGETNAAFALVRCLSDGNVDPAFGTNGISIVSATASSQHLRGDVTIENSGKLLIGGYYYGNANNYDVVLIRCNTDGSLDAGFGNNGLVKREIGISNDQCTSMTLKSNGAIVLAGYFTNGSNTDFALLQFMGGEQVYPAPSVSTLAATNLTENSAVLNGTLNPNGIHTNAWFEYGTSPAYGSTTAPVAQGSGNAPVNISAGLANLTPGLTYHFRLVAQNGEAIAQGADMSFTVGTPAGLTFADANLKAAIRAAVNKPTGDIYAVDVLALTSLNLAALGITDLGGLEEVTNLRILDIRGNPFADAAATWAILDQLSLYCLYADLPRPGGPPPGLLTQSVTTTNGGTFYITVDALNLPTLDISGLGIDTRNPANLDALDVFANAGVTVETGATNLPPAAVGTATVTNQASGATTLDGTASRDIDGTVATWACTWAGGSANGSNPSANFPVGTTNVTLTVTDDDGATGATTVEVVVLGAPEIAVEHPVNTVLTGGSSSITFLPRLVGSAGESRVVTIRNAGTAVLQNISVAVAPPGAEFALDLTGTATSLAAGATTTFALVFTPSEAGSRSADVVVGSNDADENPTTIGLLGQGIAAGGTTPGYLWTTISGQAGGLGNADGTGGAARFDNPAGIVPDGNNGYFVADSNNHVIRRVSSTGVVTTFAGKTQVLGSTNGTGTAASFNGPGGLAMKPNGFLVVADVLNQTIRQISPAGEVTLVAGLPGNQGTQNGVGTAARFRFPRGVATDLQSNIYVADSANHTIRKIETNGQVSLFAGIAGQAGPTNGDRLASRFTEPRGIAVNPDGNIYVAEWGAHTIRRIDPSGNVITLAGSPNQSGSVDGVGSAARFNRPAGLALDTNGNLLVADTENHVIRLVTPDGTVSTLAGLAATSGDADGLTGNARFRSPQAVCANAGGILVADTANSTVRKIDNGGAVTTLAGTSPRGGNVDGDLATARYNQPGGGAFDAAGNLYVADTGNHNIRKILPDGTVSVFAGGGVSGFANGLGTAARFNQPTEIVIDSLGNLLVSDKFNHRIRKITPAGEVTTHAGVGTAGSVIDGAALTARFSSPHGLAIDSLGNLFIADFNNSCIRKLDTAGNVSTFAGSSGFSGGTDATGTAARFSQPTGLAIDPDDNLYVTTTIGQTVRKITPAAVVSTLAGSHGILGTTDAILGSAARFWSPRPIAWHPDGYLIVGDWLGHTIRRIDPTGEVTTIGGSGGVGSGLDGYGQDARFSRPSGIVVRPDHSLLVMDSYNNRLVGTAARRPSVSVAAADQITGTTALLSGEVNPNGAATTAQFQYGTDLAFGMVVPVTLAPNNGSSSQAVSVELTGLVPGTTYYFRLIAENTGGLMVSTDGTFSTPGGVIFADPLLEAAIRAALAKPTGPITAADMLTLTNLNLSGLGLTSLSGLETATNLRILNLRGNAFTNAAATWAILDQLPLYCLYTDLPRPGGNPPGLTTQTVTDTFGGTFFIVVDAPNLPTLDISGLGIDTTNQANLAALQVFAAAGVTVETGGTNLPPVANATATILSIPAGTVSLNGGTSSDIDGTVASWSWSWSGGSASGVNPTVTLPVGQTTVTLMVTDDDGAASTTALTVRIVTLASAIQDAGLNGDDALATATPFNDGVENLLKYAFNMNLAGPDAATMAAGGTAGLPVISQSGTGASGVLCFEFVRRKGSGLVYTPKKSTSLDPAGWINVSDPPTVTPIGTDGLWERVVYEEPSDPAVVPACFGRVEVAIP